MAQEATNVYNDEYLFELLDQYTEALVRGGSGSRSLVEKRRITAPLLNALISTVQQLYRALTPVQPSASFIESLQADLARQHARQTRADRRWGRLRERAVSLSTVVGAVVSIVALLALIVRVVGSIVLIVMFLTRQGRSESTAAA